MLYMPDSQITTDSPSYTNNKNLSNLQFPLRLPHNVNSYCIRVHTVYLQKFLCTLIYFWTVVHLIRSFAYSVQTSDKNNLIDS